MRGNIFKWLVICLVFFMLGAWVFKFSISSIYQYKEPVQSWVNGLKKLNKDGLLTPFKQRALSPLKMEFIYSDTVATHLSMLRDSTLVKGLLTKHEKLKHAAYVVFEQDTIPIKIRLKGDYNDHRKNERWSYRCYVQDDQNVMGMKTFSVQAPGTKGGLYEWYFYELLKQADFIHLQYHFVEVNDNNRYTGVYALEESFDDDLLTRNKKEVAPILKFDENILIDETILNNRDKRYTNSDLMYLADIKVFKSNRIHDNDQLYHQFCVARTLLDDVRLGVIDLDSAFDVNATAKLFALVDLAGAQHGLMWKNVRFYFNPDIQKLELIAYDAASGWPFDDNMFNRWKNDTYYGIYADAWFSIFFSNENFLKLYHTYLAAFSTLDYVSTFENATQAQAEKWQSCLVGDASYRTDYMDYYKKNAGIIRHKLAQKKKFKKDPIQPYLIHAKAELAEDGLSQNILVQNNSFQEVVISQLLAGEEQVNLLEKFQLITHRKTNQPAQFVTIGKVNVDNHGLKIGIYLPSGETIFIPVKE